MHSTCIAGAFALTLLILPFSAAAQTAVRPPASQASAAPAVYRIQKGDKLSIKFFSHPELNEPTMVVRPDGFITPQLIGEVRAEGMTVEQLKSLLEREYVEFLLAPMITVAVVEFVAPRVFVGGQVNRPGKYELREASTAVQAIFLAGGFTGDAHRSMVVHARPNDRGDWDIETLNVLKMMKRDGGEKDVELRDGDYLFIPDSKIARMNKAVEAFRAFVPGRIF